ncbi:hypothetical protein [Streptomyces sp. 891-h]|uniref:hypothetical protein n=1 Tax=Streptomyces sp. 891-h TaxID=2720714 RepID=UPI001FAA895B|nr:hypothetical protein [Streptomyces sp. 891-h]UNZ16903.1 hypothetical protein HC362_07300 [Streptomyces sp. 891-h]
MAALGGLAGCGSQQESSSGDDEDELAHRARQVAEAWDGATATAEWRAGYHPMGDVIQLPSGGLHSRADKQALRDRNLVLRGELPDTSPKDGKVTWEGGRSLERPVIGAREAYKSLAGSGGERPHLTVTGAKLGTMTLDTSRGKATVPAWLFSLDGYGSPLKRAAVVPSKLPTPPIKPTSDVSGFSLHHLVRIADDGHSVTVVAQHGACDSGPVVKALETRDSVVLSATVGKREKGGHCTKQAKLQQVTVKLDRPLRDRVLLDAITGRPVPFRGLVGPTPSWS